MLTGAFVVQFVLLFATPAAIALWLNRRLGLPWMLFLGGALAFVVSWTVTVFVPPQFSLFASSITQMGALYLIYRFMLNTVDTEREALMVGAGQGGIELLILVVFLAIPTLTQMRSLRSATDETLVNLIARSERISEAEVEPTDIDKLRETIDDYWSTAWYIPLLQAIPSLATLPAQLALAVIVLAARTRRSLRPLVGAMALHFLARSLPAFAQYFGGIVLALAVSVLVGGVAIWFLRRLWPRVQEQSKAALKEQRKSGKRVRKAG